MATTTWHPRTSFTQPRQWLLTNGEIVTEPPLEQTATGRKVRVAGTDLSAFSRDMDELILRSVYEFAEQKKTQVWMPLDGREKAMNGLAGISSESTTDLYVLTPDLTSTTKIWWRFRHPTLPIEAIVTVDAGRVTPGYAGSQHRVATTVTVPHTHPVRRDVWQAMTFDAERVTTPAFQELYVGDVNLGSREFVRDNTPEWAHVLEGRVLGTERAMVGFLLTKVREIDQYETIQIPDFRDSDNPTWLDLELYETNYSPTIASELAEYLDGTPTLTEALRIYGELQACLRGVGMVMEDKTENDFQKALLAGDAAGLTVDIGTPHAPQSEGGWDHDHSLTMHLASGTFVVNCSATVNYGDVADRWDEALTIASLRGEEDTLLTFAREAAREGQTKRSRTTVRERTGQAHE